MKVNNQEVGLRIKVIRKKLGMTMREFGEEFDPIASDRIVSKWEKGLSFPNSTRLKRIAELGNITVEYLVHGQDTETPFLDAIKQLHQEKDMDAIAELIENIYTMYGLRMDEVAALNYYLVERTLKAKHNARSLREEFKTDVTRLDIDGILQAQQTLIVTYLEKLKEDNNRSSVS